MKNQAGMRMLRNVVEGGKAQLLALSLPHDLPNRL